MTEVQQPLLLVFGTSADPFHQGHANLIVAAARALLRKEYQISQVMIMPVYRHHNTRDAIKRSLPFTYESRFAICQLAADEIGAELAGSVERVSVSRLEEKLVKDNHRPNLTAETFASLREQVDAGIELAFLMGMDNLAGEDPPFNHWYQMDKFIQLASLVICPRRGFEANPEFIKSLQEKGARLIFLEDVLVPEISSSEIRGQLEKGTDPEQMVRAGFLSPAIANYIEENNLAETWRQLDSSQSTTGKQIASVELTSIEARIGKILSERKLTLALAESCTGGLVSHRITNVPGSSEYFIGGVVSYAYAAKVDVLGVRWDTLKAFGAVSSETVLEMARGARRALKTDIGLSVSCIAGPGGATPNKPVGTSWVGLVAADGEWSRHFLLHGDRLGNKEALAQKALELLLEYLEG
ncbi:MAG: nicotinamide-nucleotide amidohydrolase family protein [Anaerolineaceae bacterium]